MRSYLVTEGKTDEAILTPILKALGLSDLQVVNAGGKALTTSLANSLALTRQAPVAVVVDADTTDASTIRQQHRIFEDLTIAFSGRSRCRLFQAIPSLDEDLFPKPGDFEEILAFPLSMADRKAFKSDRSKFLRRWVDRLNTPIDPARINVAKARETIESSGLRGLVDYLNGIEEHAAVAG